MTDVSTQQTGSSATKEISVTTAIVIDENVLGISFGSIEGHDVENPICGACGQYNALGIMFGLIAKGVDGKICEACGEKSGQYGVSLARLVEGLEEIDSALASSTPDDQLVLLKMAHEALGWLVDRYASTVAEADVVPGKPSSPIA